MSEKTIGQALEQANKNVRKRDFERDLKSRVQTKELKQSLLQQWKEITGEDHFIGTSKDIFKGELFNQVMHRNLDLLNRIGYLNQAESDFLFRIQAYLEFKSKVIIRRENKFKKQKNIMKMILNFLRLQLSLKFLKWLENQDNKLF